MQFYVELALVAILLIGASAFAQEEYRPRGYAGFVEEGLAGCTATGDILHSSTATIHGYQINPNWFIGAGLAVDIDIPLVNTVIQTPMGAFVTDNSPVSGLPLFADVRCDLTKKRISPFVDFRAGYSPCGDFRKGAYVSPTIGCDFFFRNHPKMGLYCGVMYEYQQCNRNGSTGEMHYVGAKFGFRW